MRFTNGGPVLEFDSDIQNDEPVLEFDSDIQTDGCVLELLSDIQNKLHTIVITILLLYSKTLFTKLFDIIY